MSPLLLTLSSLGLSVAGVGEVYLKKCYGRPEISQGGASGGKGDLGSEAGV